MLTVQIVKVTNPILQKRLEKCNKECQHQTFKVPLDFRCHQKVSLSNIYNVKKLEENIFIERNFSKVKSAFLSNLYRKREEHGFLANANSKFQSEDKLNMTDETV